jgi:dTDP-4-dehydrorhamnose 3,5-epimerase
VTTWADIARQVFTVAGHDPNRVTGVSTDEYFASTEGPVAPRPRNSVLGLAKIVSTGYVAADASESLLDYLRQETLVSQQQVKND